MKPLNYSIVTSILVISLYISPESLCISHGLFRPKFTGLTKDYLSLQVVASSSTLLPPGIRRQVLDLLHLRKRTEEEENMCREEMALFLHSMKKRHTWLAAELVQTPENDAQRGLNSKIHEELEKVEHMYAVSSKSFSNHITDIPSLNYQYNAHVFSPEDVAEPDELFECVIESDESDSDDE